MDKLTKEQRSMNMAAIRSKNTKPELILRGALFSKGYRFRVHYKIGKTSVDIAFPSLKKAINVHGCFWHQHQDCSEASNPKTNSEYWRNKFEKNLERDKKNQDFLKSVNWYLLVIWECQIEKDLDRILKITTDFLTL